jgi:hypothetical protein
MPEGRRADLRPDGATQSIGTRRRGAYSAMQPNCFSLGRAAGSCAVLRIRAFLLAALAARSQAATYPDRLRFLRSFEPGWRPTGKPAAFRRASPARTRSLCRADSWRAEPASDQPSSPVHTGGATPSRCHDASTSGVTGSPSA